jgi:hypothetical protein
MVKGFPRRVLFGTTVLAGFLVSVAPCAAQNVDVGLHHRSAMGVRDNGPLRTLFHIHLEVPDGADPDMAANEALEALHARPVGPGDLLDLGFAVTGARWPRFFNHGKRDDRVVQYYNPAGAPIPDSFEPILQSAQTTWSTVTSSRFKYEPGGLTTRPPQTGDGFNDVGWQAIPLANAIGITAVTIDWVSGEILDADVSLSPLFDWTTDGVVPPPPPPPPPSCFTLPKGTPPPPECIIRPPKPAYDVETVLLHEDGHALGLDHIGDPTAVMYAFYNGVQRALADGDIAGVTYLYPRHPVRTVTRRDPSAGYRLIASVGDVIPSLAGFFASFEPGGLNARGDASFTSGVSDRCSSNACVELGGQAVFAAQHRGMTQVVRTTQAAPGNPNPARLGGGVVGASALNDRGDLAFGFSHNPAPSVPYARNAGVYRYDWQSDTTNAVVVPFVTAARGCGAEPAGRCVLAGGWKAAINNRGDVAFAGVLMTPVPGLGDEGIFVAERSGQVTTVVAAGSRAPTGDQVFDYAASPSINDAGDVAFDGHLTGDLWYCLSNVGRCLSSVYRWRATTEHPELIARQGAPAPDGGTFRYAVEPVLNNRGEILFSANLSASGNHSDLGLFLFSRGMIIPVVRPGEEMPGGGRLLTTSLSIASGPVYSLSDDGVVAFNATLDTDEDEDGVFDTGVYVWERGRIRLIARSGTVMPGVGEILAVQDPYAYGSRTSYAGALLNTRGEVLFQAILTDWRVVLLVAEPPKRE